MARFGTLLREPYSKPIQGEKYRGLWELRIKSARDISRIFYFLPTGSTIILLHGFVKKTDKIPTGELQAAVRNKEDYLRRCQE